MIKKYVYIFLLAVIVNSPLVAQLAYYTTDSSTCFGIEVVNRGAYYNSKQCEVLIGNKPHILGPDKVKEYRLSNGRIYFSRRVLIEGVSKKVFLERIVKGKINLYYYKGDKGSKFFLDKDSLGFVEIVKRDEKGNSVFPGNIAKYINDCDTAVRILGLVTFHKAPLKTFINGYNSSTLLPFPFIRYGILIGVEKSELNQYNKITDPTITQAIFTQDYSSMFGLYLDIPIHQSNFSFHPEIYIAKEGFSAHYEDYKSIADLVINTTSINLPILFRYTIPYNKCRPYLNLGISFNENIKNSNKVFRGSKDNNVIEFESATDIPLISAFQYGGVIGGGVQFPINYRNSVFIEARYNRLFGSSDLSLGKSTFQLFSGINF